MEEGETAAEPLQFPPTGLVGTAGPLRGSEASRGLSVPASSARLQPAAMLIPHQLELVLAQPSVDTETKLPASLLRVKEMLKLSRPLSGPLGVFHDISPNLSTVIRNGGKSLQLDLERLRGIEFF